jgi:hypothetical protein
VRPDRVVEKDGRRIAAKVAGHPLVGSVGSPIDLVKDPAEIRESIIFLA